MLTGGKGTLWVGCGSMKVWGSHEALVLAKGRLRTPESKRSQLPSPTVTSQSPWHEFWFRSCIHCLIVAAHRTHFIFLPAVVWFLPSCWRWLTPWVRDSDNSSALLSDPVYSSSRPSCYPASALECQTVSQITNKKNGGQIDEVNKHIPFQQKRRGPRLTVFQNCYCQ